MINNEIKLILNTLSVNSPLSLWCLCKVAGIKNEESQTLKSCGKKTIIINHFLKTTELMTVSQKFIVNYLMKAADSEYVYFYSYLLSKT